MVKDTYDDLFPPTQKRTHDNAINNNSVKKGKMEEIPQKAKEKDQKGKEEEVEERKFKIISIFNHKGGVSKTTTTYALGWELARLGYRVMLVDADAQCNLSQLILQNGFDKLNANVPDEEDASLVTFDHFYEARETPGMQFPPRPNNVFDSIKPVVTEQPVPLQAANLYTVTSFGDNRDQKRPALLLLCGHPMITEFEDKLAMAYGSNGMIAPNSLGAMSHLISLTAVVTNVSFSEYHY